MLPPEIRPLDLKTPLALAGLREAEEDDRDGQGDKKAFVFRFKTPPRESDRDSRCRGAFFVPTPGHPLPPPKLPLTPFPGTPRLPLAEEPAVAVFARAPVVAAQAVAAATVVVVVVEVVVVDTIPVRPTAEAAAAAAASAAEESEEVEDRERCTTPPPPTPLPPPPPPPPALTRFDAGLRGIAGPLSANRRGMGGATTLEGANPEVRAVAVAPVEAAVASVGVVGLELEVSGLTGGIGRGRVVLEGGWGKRGVGGVS